MYSLLEKYVCDLRYWNCVCMFVCLSVGLSWSVRSRCCRCVDFWSIGSMCWKSEGLHIKENKSLLTRNPVITFDGTFNLWGTFRKLINKVFEYSSCNEKQLGIRKVYLLNMPDKLWHYINTQYLCYMVWIECPLNK